MGGEGIYTAYLDDMVIYIKCTFMRSGEGRKEGGKQGTEAIAAAAIVLVML